MDIDLESLSDHIPITFMIKKQGNNDTTKKGNSTFVRWKIKEFNNELFTETLEWNINNNQWREDGRLDDKQQYLSKTLIETMDLVTKRQNTKKKIERIPTGGVAISHKQEKSVSKREGNG